MGPPEPAPAEPPKAPGPPYLSYTSFSLFEKDPAAFWKQYMVFPRPKREPQTPAMAAGSAFDAFIKADLHARYIGDGDPKFQLQALFESQVEKPIRDEGWRCGEDLLRQYKAHGAYGELTRLMRGCVNLRMETELTGRVLGVDLLGKPDLQFMTPQGARIILDWKVNGRYSKTPKSPTGGFISLFPGGKAHKDVVFGQYKGFPISLTPFDKRCEDWAEQLTIYAWTLGEPVGADTVLLVDQLACNMGAGTIRVARHAGVCDEDWQHALAARIKTAWVAIKSGHLFQALSREENDAKIESLKETTAVRADMPDEFKALIDPPKRFW